MKNGKFITIEGSEGAGKSTAIHYLQTLFTELKREVIFTREPGGTQIAEEIRKVLLFPKSEEKMCADTELLLMFAGRAQHLNHCILPALAAGTWVVSDRYIDASYAYQGGGRELSMQSIQTLDKLVVGAHYPDLTLLLDVPVDMGLTRTEKRTGTKDRIEQEKQDFFERVRKAYLTRAKEVPQRIKVINAALSLTEVQAQIRECLLSFIKDVA